MHANKPSYISARWVRLSANGSRRASSWDGSSVQDGSLSNRPLPPCIGVPAAVLRAPWAIR